MATLPETMTAIAIREPGGPEVLAAEQRPLPALGDTDILIRVAAAGVNRPDLFQRAGAYPPPPGASDLPGLEAAGTVAAIGPDVTRWKVGDAVCALTPGGAYAQYVRVDAGNALPVPEGLDAVEAAALPETCFTVWHNVFERGRLQEGETLLVHGGSSGIGTTAIQLGKAFGATVLVTTRGTAKAEACRRLGADLAVDTTREDWQAAVKEATGGRGVEVILDMVGGPTIARNYEAAAMDGRIVQIAFLQGAKVEIDFTRLMTKRLVHTGSTMRPQSVAAKAGIARALEQKVWPLIGAGRCRPIIHATYPLERAADAHAALEGGAHFGKVVLVAGAKP